MGRKSTPITILNNNGTSEVFFALVGKELSPKDIKEKIDIANSSISEQLGRLSKAGIIEYKQDSRDKRNKFYYINWNRFAEVVCDYYKKNSELFHSSICPITKLKISEADAIRLLEKIKNNSEFVRLIKNYFIGFTDKIYSTDKITEALKSFEEDLLWSKCNLGSELSLWRKHIYSHYEPRKDLFEKSVG